MSVSNTPDFKLSTSMLDTVAVSASIVTVLLALDIVLFVKDVVELAVGEASTLSCKSSNISFNTDIRTVVRMAVVKEMFEDLHDRVDAGLTASSSTVFTNKTFDVEATGNSISNIDVADLKSGVLDTDIGSVSGDDTTLASAKAIKTYVDAQVATKPSIGLILALGG